MPQVLANVFGNTLFAWGLLIVVILVVLVLLFALFRRLLLSPKFSLSGSGRQQPRLAVTDVFDLDRQRQLVLVRRDNVEHLIMIGGPNDVLIETAITRMPAAQPAPQPATPQELATARSAPPRAQAARTAMPGPAVEPPPLPGGSPGGSPAVAPPQSSPPGAGARPAPPPRPAAFPPRPMPPRPAPIPPGQPSSGAAKSALPPGAAAAQSPAGPSQPAPPLDSLEEEMAKLLGRPGPPKS